MGNCQGRDDDHRIGIVDDAAAQVEKQTGFLLSENERAELLGLVERARAELKDGGEDLGFLKELVDSCICCYGYDYEHSLSELGVGGAVIGGKVFKCSP